MTNNPSGSKYNLLNKTAIVIDNGLYFEFALQLAKHFKQVFYFCEFRSAFPGIDKAAVGNEYVNGHALHTFDGLNIHRITELYDVIDQVDIAIFPDVGNGDLAEYLRRQGMPVFGSGKGEVLELSRMKAKAMIQDQGLPVHPYNTVIGTAQLREAISSSGSLYVKISKYRGVFETYHHTSPEQTAIWINDIEQRLGKLADIVHFIIEDPLETKVEIGTDSYTVNGKYPSMTLAGVEIKDLGYCGQIFKYSEQPKGVLTVDEGLKPIFADLGYRGFYSTEIRETANGDPHLVDFTARIPLPPGFLYPLMYENIGDIIWGIAIGEMVEPVIAKKYGMMVMLYSPWYTTHMLHVRFPPEYRENIQMMLPVKIDGEYYCISEYSMDEFGAVSVAGDTIEECVENAGAILSTIEAYQFTYDANVMEKAMAAFKEMEQMA
jgi:hypothetical protein